MDAVTALERLGGIADARSLLRLTTRRRVRRALREGLMAQGSRGRYVLPTASDAHAKAAELSAVVSLRSAAAHYGWELKTQPGVPELTIRRKRNLPAEQRKGVRLLWVDLPPDDLRQGVTTPLRTVIDCARHLPFDEALAIADSALRSGLVTRADFDGAFVQGGGAGSVRRVLEAADGRATNAFESVLRALCLLAGLDVVPQLGLDLGTGTIHPDLVDLARKVALEADSWTFHTGRKAHRRDCARYNLLVLRGWRVLRFTWEQVMHDQPYVRWVLAELVRPVERDEVGLDLDRSA